MNTHQLFAGLTGGGASGVGQLLKGWDAHLDTLRFGLNRNLGGANLLSADQRESLLSVFCDELVVAQHQFLQKAEQNGIAVAGEPVRDKIETTNFFPAAEMMVAIGAGIASASVAGGWIVATTSVTTGMLWWKATAFTSITLVAALATKFNVPATVVVTGIFILAAFLCFKIFRAATCSLQRRYIRRLILKNFDLNIRPKLIAWAEQTLKA